MTYAALPILLLLAAAAAACGPKNVGGGGDPALAAVPDVPFDQLNHDQKYTVMKYRVMPAMRTLFRSYDPEKFAQIDCKTCHGPAVDRDEYHMPNDELPKLNFANLAKYKQADLDFMKNQVKPKMAKLLKLPEHTEQNPEGFGCLNCHTEEK
jgi:hypothetical protein